MNMRNNDQNVTPPPPQQPSQGFTPSPQSFRQQLFPSENNPGKGMSIASLVMGICTLFVPVVSVYVVISGLAFGKLGGGFSLIAPYVGVATATVGLILGMFGKQKSMEANAPTGIATAGIVISVIGVVIALLTLEFCISCNRSLGCI